MTKSANRTHASAAIGPTSLADYRDRSRPATTAVDAPADTPAADMVALGAFFAEAAKSDRRGADYHRMVAAVLDRADRVAEPDLREWNRFLSLLERHRDNPRAALNCAVLANLVGIAAFGDPVDFVTLDELTCLIGGERVAAVQHRSARFIEPDPTYPITTVALRRMVALASQPVAGSVLDSAIALLREGIDLDQHLPVIRSQSELVGVVDGGSVLEWRHHLAMIGASPWSPYSRHIVELAKKADRPEVAALVREFTAVCREHNKEREREQVAEEVRRLVSASGASQRQFAHWVGTSPSRLSTYISGSVTPSASMMLRMKRTSRLLGDRELPRGIGGAADPTERGPGPLGRGRSHLSAV